MNRYRKAKPFENNEHIGAYAELSFAINGDVEAGSESIQFDTKIHYVDVGEGAPLLLVHGIGQSLYTWRHSISYFADHGYRVIAPDLIGFGYSGHPNIYYTVEEQSIVLRAFLDALGINTAYVAAFSTGCLSAICLAAETPERVSRLVLVSPGGPNENYPFPLRMLTTWLGCRLMPLLVGDGSVKALLHNLYFDATKLTEDVAHAYALPYRNEDVRETLVMSLVHHDDTYVRSLLKSVSQPTLVFFGMDDRIHREEMVRAYAVNIPGARHMRVRNCGHFVHEEKHAKFNAEALTFSETRHF